MQTVNNNTPEQINSALFAIGNDITKQNVQTKNAIKSSESTLQKQIDKITDSLQNNGGLIIGGTYNINISGNASTSTNATNAINATNATKDSAGNVITTTYATKAEVPTNNNQLTNGAGYITSSGSITGNAATSTTAANLGRDGNTSVPMTFHWNGLAGQPTWLWGGNDGSNMYVYNPSNFNVNHATSSDSATNATNATSAGSATNATNAQNLAITGYGNSCFTFYQTDSAFAGRSNWASYLICNHGNGESYYSQIIAMPFWGVPCYRRLESGNSTGWHSFITDENIGSQSVANATTALKIRTSAPSSPAAGDIWIS